MRILTVVGGLGPGGTERAAQNFALGYKDAGYESAVLAYNEGGARVQTLEASGLPVFIGGRLPGEQMAAIDAALQWGFDAIHIHLTGSTDWLSADVLRALDARRKVVVETNVFSRVDYSANRTLIDVHLQLSRWCLWKWSQWKRHLSPDPIGVVIPYLVRSDAFFASGFEERRVFRTRLDIPAGAPLIGRIGQKLSSKWSPLIFEIFATVMCSRPDSHLVLVGLPDQLKVQLHKLPSELRNNIRLIDFLHGDAKLRACYSSFDAFLHISRIGESFGMVLAEAMLCESPVVTLSTPLKDNSQVEVVGHQIGGLVAASAVSLSTSVLRLLNDRLLHDQLASRGRQWVLEQYDTPVVMEKLLRVLYHIQAAAGREDLRTRLAGDPHLVTHVGPDEIKALLTNIAGQHTRRERAGMRLIHQPTVYRVWQRVKQLRQSLH